ncbi:hypothetical protein E4T42_06061 [Aureobasidium subglaciale]|nr:hypothetical protein E4T42_06061 [Aureobasidium subglaciale]
MLSSNSYLDYERSTAYLIYWLCHASNSVIQTQSSEQRGVRNATENTTGQVTVAELVSMARRIAANLQEVPTTIYRLFRSVIKARSHSYVMFQELAAAHSDAEMEASNVTHKHFVDKLEEAFEILGGREWLARQQAENEKAEDLVEVERVIFCNPFLPLTLDNSAQDTSEQEDSHAQHPSISQRRTKKHRKDKIRQKKKKAKASSEPIVEDVPLESYRIIDGPDDLVTDYYIAVTSIVDECYNLRQFAHKHWFHASHSGLNSAVAGTVSRLAVSMMRRTVLAIFVDFPSKKDTVVEMNEALSMHVYRDLHDFVVDYQKNRSGKPTRSMQIFLSKWDPDLDLSQACKTDRVTWRRMFTIHWLYDLVNVYVYSLRKFNPADFEGVALESGPWSYQD